MKGGGGIMQLVAYGAQDVFLTGNPQFTYWRQVFKRHTNFAMESIPMFFRKKPSFAPRSHSKIVCEIYKNGDLLSDVYFVIDLPPIYGDKRSCFRWNDYLGYQIINSAKVVINGQTIDTQYSQWMAIWQELTLPEGRRTAYDRMIGNSPDFKIYNRTNFSTNDADYSDSVALYSRKRLYVPLLFWFCRNPGLALPLVPIRDQVQITLEINPTNEWFVMGAEGLRADEYFDLSNGQLTNDDVALRNKLVEAGYSADDIWYYFLSQGLGNTASNWNEHCFLLSRFIFLGDEESDLFRQMPHTYLITQTQEHILHNLKNGFNQVEIKALNPVKEVIFAVAKSGRGNLNFTQFRNPEIFDYLNKAVSNQVNAMHYITTATGFLLFESDLALSFQGSIYIKHLADIMQQIYLNQTGDSANISDEAVNIFQGGKFIFNGKDRFEYKDRTFFGPLQQYQYHTNKPRIKEVYSYSFALEPEKDIPTGHCNFSRIKKFEFAFNLKDSATTNRFTKNYGMFAVYNKINESNVEKLDEIEESDITFSDTTDYCMYFYTMNFNILRISGGFGKLGFET